MIVMVISLVNLLLSTVNDLLDLRLIAEDKFAKKDELFKPQETFKFILSMFAPLIQLKNC